MLMNRIKVKQEHTVELHSVINNTSDFSAESDQSFQKHEHFLTVSTSLVFHALHDVITTG